MQSPKLDLILFGKHTILQTYSKKHYIISFRLVLRYSNFSKMSSDAMSNPLKVVHLLRISDGCSNIFEESEQLKFGQYFYANFFVLVLGGWWHKVCSITCTTKCPTCP